MMPSNVWDLLQKDQEAELSGGREGRDPPLAVQAGGRRGFTTRPSALPWVLDPASSAADPRPAGPPPELQPPPNLRR